MFKLHGVASLSDASRIGGKCFLAPIAHRNRSAEPMPETLHNLCAPIPTKLVHQK
jgi:hypothetical protein